MCMANRFTKKHDTQDLKQLFAEAGCVLLSEYQNAATPVTYKCKCGNISKIRVSRFLEGQRCRNCGAEKAKKHRLIPFNEVKSEFDKFNYTLLINEGDYTNGNTPLPCICDKGHTTSIRYCFFKLGTRCRQCYIDRNSGELHYRWNPDRQYVEQLEKFTRLSRAMVRHALKYISEAKTEQSKILLGYTPLELKDHIDNHPNTKNIDNWTIDHVFPIKAFIEYGITDLKIINALDNLQPLNKVENSKKSDKYDPIAFEAYLKKKGIVC